jgi:hypothetical protein
MSSIRNPVGPQPSSVYWRRRLLVGGGLLLIIIVILLIIFAPKGTGDPTSTSSKPPSKSPTSTSTAQVPDEAVPCEAADIVLTPVTDKDSYAAGEQPLLSMTIANIGTEPCMINAGTDVQEYRITSGPDPIWNSKDCQTNPVTTPIVLEPGVEHAQKTTPFPWDRTRSAEDTCTSERPPVVAGGATYRLRVLLGTIESADDKPFLLF